MSSTNIKARLLEDAMEIAFVVECPLSDHYIDEVLVYCMYGPKLSNGRGTQKYKELTRKIGIAENKEYAPKIRSKLYPTLLSPFQPNIRMNVATPKSIAIWCVCRRRRCRSSD